MDAGRRRVRWTADRGGTEFGEPEAGGDFASLPRALLELEPRVRDEINAHHFARTADRGGGPARKRSGKSGAINLAAAKAYRTS
jgi:hypothetical protein